jgi:hypothetical protein
MSILIGAVPSAPAKTMIVEFPDASCNGASSSPKKGKMASARSAIIAACGQPSSSHYNDPRREDRARPRVHDTR